MRILVDADACPVKEEIYRVARRVNVPVWVVANNWFRVPIEPLIRQIVVSDGFDAADNWIAENAGPDAIVITADILLADRALKTGATVIGPTGKPFSVANIGNAVAARAMAEDRRAYAVEMGRTTGPAPFSPRDRSAFLSALDAAVSLNDPANDNYVAFTIFDNGGTDTVDMSGFAGAQVIDLRQGASSDVLGGRLNMGIAYGTVVERAFGGSGNDALTHVGGNGDRYLVHGSIYIKNNIILILLNGN